MSKAVAQGEAEVRSRYVASMFARIARRYDLMNTLMTAGQDRRWRRLAVRLALTPALSQRERESGGTRLGLDVAAGTGDLALALAREGGLDGVVAVDFCEEMLQVARAKLARVHHKDKAPRSGQSPNHVMLSGAKHLAHRAERSSDEGEPDATAGTPDNGDKGVIEADASLPLSMTCEGTLGANGSQAPIALVVGDGLRLPFPDDTFVCATVGFGVRNFVDLPLAFAETRRVLKPGGRIACLELTRSPDGLFNRFFDLYFDRIVPLVGKVVAGDGEAYSYLPSSVKRFPPADELAGIMRAAGLRDVQYRRLGLGTVAIHVGTK